MSRLSESSRVEFQSLALSQLARIVQTALTVGISATQIENLVRHTLSTASTTQRAKRVKGVADVSAA